MKEKECLADMYEKDYLNELGLKRYIEWLKQNVKDYGQDIKEVCSKKGLTTKDESAKG